MSQQAPPPPWQPAPPQQPSPPPGPYPPPPPGHPQPPPGPYPPPGPSPTPPPGQFGPPSPPRQTNPILIVGLGLIGAVVLGGIVAAIIAGLPDNAERDPSGEITRGGNVSAFDLKQGDCFDLPRPSSEVYDVDGVPCDQAHDAEVFSTFSIESDDFPGQRAVIMAAQRGCTSLFGDFVGIALQKSRFEVQYLYPTERSWTAQDDREVVCAVTDPKGKLTADFLAGANQ
jgi:Septum formation